VESLPHAAARRVRIRIQRNGNIACNTQKGQQTHLLGLSTELKPTKISLSAPRADDETEGRGICTHKHLALWMPEDATTIPIKSRAHNKN